MKTKILLPGGGFEPPITAAELMGDGPLGVFSVSYLPGAKRKLVDAIPVRVVKWFGGVVGFWADGHVRVFDAKEATSDSWVDCRFHRLDEVPEVHFVIGGAK